MGTLRSLTIVQQRDRMNNLSVAYNKYNVIKFLIILSAILNYSVCTANTEEIQPHLQTPVVGKKGTKCYDAFKRPQVYIFLLLFTFRCCIVIL